MLRHSLRVLAVAAVAAFALSPSPAAAVTLVNSCRDLDKAGETYILTADINATGTCFVVLADRITLDLAGYTVTGSGSPSSGIWDNGGARTSTVVKNGSIKGFRLDAISLGTSTRSTIRAVTASENGLGMIIGPASLVKECIVQRNGGHAIIIGDGGQVEGCNIGGNVGFGVDGGQRTLVTRNIVKNNGFGGIRVGENSTVTHNTSSENGVDGIGVGPRSLVTSNTANDNGQDGIQAACPSTITHNTALGNDLRNFNPVGQGCVDLHNNFTDPE
jgi:hypothetical protein